MKILSLYLPAYHQIKENDEWWGEGFTEWDNVKKATKLYKNHYQPVKPLNDNYYDLSKKEDIENQIELANKYGVDGFIFYHYWMDTNKMLLEKPAEILKDEIKSKIEYCFCWANQDWITTWHGNKEKSLMKQNYGDEEEWIAHIKYFVQFFKDERYIKIDNRPVLFIYNVAKIENYEEMIKCWNSYLKEQGINDIYTVEYIFSRNKDLTSNVSDGVMEFEPLYTTFFDITKINKLKRYICKKYGFTDFQNYDKLWNYIIKRKRTYYGKTIFKSCFSGWDNSPRKHKESMIVKYGSAKKFGKNLNKLINVKRKDSSEDYLVINAWNEWGEGAQLEPTSHEGYAYLEEIKKIKKI